jgi:hypothetical protein
MILLSPPLFSHWKIPLNHEKCTVSIMQCCRNAFHKVNVIKPTHAELTRIYCTYNGATITLLYNVDRAMSKTILKRLVHEIDFKKLYKNRQI